MRNPNALDPAESAFLLKAQRYFQVPEVQVVRTGAPTGDIAVDLGQTPPCIVIGYRWERSNPRRRKSKLVHELLHITGLGHNKRARKLGYFSNPSRDTLSPQVLEAIEAGNPRFYPKVWGIR